MRTTSAHEVTSTCSLSGEKRWGSTSRTHQVLFSSTFFDEKGEQ